ncbi:MAG TPA: cytochrome c [Terriglobales bacterium]|jgi:mono/diheme cytochrome c family protein|nr:cytochrome c [Terriglobales bacterium]
MKKLRTILPALIALTFVTAGCRIDMHVQPYFRPLTKSDFFADGRSARNPVEGTVARGDLREDAYLYTGKVNGNLGDYMPFAVTKEVLDHGHERFNVYCTPCHGRVGDGNGFIPSRGLKRPPSYHIDRLRKVPVGYFFDVMTNGFGVMQDYSAQVPPRDRWAIAAYIRALQLSQNATSADVPAGQKVPSEAPNFRDVGTGATLPVVEPKASESEGEPKQEHQQ